MNAQLSPFERWMVKSNLKHLQEYGGIKVVVARLKAGGYKRVAAAVKLAHRKASL